MTDGFQVQTEARVSLWATTVVLRLIWVVVTVVNFAVIARLLGPEESGQFFVFLSVVLLIATAAELGLSQSAIVFPGRAPEALRQIHGVLLKFAASFSLAAGAVSLVVFAIAGERLLPAFPTGWMVVACIAVPAALYANLWNGMAVGMGRLITAGKLQLSVGLLALLLNAVVLGVVRRTAGAAVGVYVLSLFVQAAAMMSMARSLAPAPDTGQHAGLTRAMLGFGLRSYAGGVSTFLWMRLTVFLLNAFQGAAAVGLFYVALQVVEKVLLPVHVIREVLYRSVTASDRATATNDTNRSIRLTVAVLAPLALIAAAFAPVIVTALFGPSYQSSVLIFRILLAGAVVMAVPTLLAPYFLGQLGRPGLLSVLAWVNGVVNGGLALWLIPRFGGVGAAAALLVSQVLGTAILMALYLRYASTEIDRVVVVQSQDVSLLFRHVSNLLRLRGARS
jgi:O-antigen/teichoic acid export membrane protein